MKKFIFISLLFFSVLTNVYSVTYYVSSDGDDLNPGITESLPWQTIDKVNSMMALILPGDQILFKRGDSFYGTINVSKSGAAGNEIVFGSYGSGNLPVITGKKLITGWTLHSGNIYSADINLTDTISNIYINSQIMTKARYPNASYLRTDLVSGNAGFYDAELTQQSGYWVNADCKIRTTNWSYEIRKVSEFGSGSITYTSPTVYSNYTNYGYYFDNKFELLDVEKEWHHNQSIGKLYFYAPGGSHPDNFQVEAVILRYGIYTNPNIHNIKVKDLHIEGFRDNCIDFFSGNNKTLSGCIIRQSRLHGILAHGSNHVIENNIFEDNLNIAISGVMTFGTIRNNNINRTGLIPGYGNSGNGYRAIHASNCFNTTIEFNKIDSTGYNGISVAKNNLVKNNFINYSCLILNDGGGIDITDCDTLRVLNNVIGNTIGNFETSGITDSYSCGIYVNGAVMKNTTIQGNTVYNSRYMGILIDHKNTPSNNKIIGNLCYNNFSAQMLFTDFSAINFVPSYNTIVKNNILYSLSADQACLHLRGHTSSGISDYGHFDSNYYCNPYSEFLVRRTRFQPVFTSNVHTLDYWKNTFGKDLNSKSLQFSFDQFRIIDTLSSNMLTNSNFTTSIHPWGGWPAAGVTLGWTTHPLLDTGCLRMRWNGTGGSIGLTLSNRYSVTTGSHYLVSVSSVGNQSGTFSLWGFSSLSSTTFTFPQTFFNFDDYRKNQYLIYRADVTDPLAYIGLGLSLPDSLVFIDNLKMFEVNVEKIDSTEKSKLFVNENNFVKNIPLNGITYKDLDGNLITGSITLQPYSSRILINDNFFPSSQLHLSALIEGLYNPTSNKMIPDSMIVYIRNAESPYSIIDSNKSVLDSNGNGTFSFNNVVNSTNYFISVKHRNSLETWSNGTVSFNSDQLSYDFTTASNKAYGNNLKLKGSRYCIYSGEIIHDGEIEMWDFLNGFNAVSNFSTGYVVEDMNGDNNVDLDDLNIIYNNSVSFVRVRKP